MAEGGLALTPLGPQSRFGDALTLIPSDFSPKRECGPKGANVLVLVSELLKLGQRPKMSSVDVFCTA